MNSHPPHMHALLACTHALLVQGFCVTIEHVESLSSNDLLTVLKSKELRSPDVSRALGTGFPDGV